MATDEKRKEEIRNERLEEAKLATPQAEELHERARERRNDTVKKMNNWWLWFGVLILIAILIWFLFSIGLFEDASGVINGN